ncbi:MAG TPA: hypothetical protein VJP40_09015, partial [bacterium]|nr:hypothetical protein [bacterium]
PVELDSKDYLRVTIPAESAESARLVYGMEGNKVEAFPKDGDVIELNAYIMFDETPILGNFLFDGLVEGGNNTLQITGTDPIGYSMKIRFNSSGQSDDIDSAVPLVLEAAGATVEAVQSGGLDEIQNEPTVPVFFGEQVQSFTQQGVLDIRFVVAQPVDDGGQDQGGDNNENPPEAEASGGCSMAPNAAGSALNLLGLLPLAGLALARRRK